MAATDLLTPRVGRTPPCLRFLPDLASPMAGLFVATPPSVAGAIYLPFTIIVYGSIGFGNHAVLTRVERKTRRGVPATGLVVEAPAS